MAEKSLLEECKKYFLNGSKIIDGDKQLSQYSSLINETQKFHSKLASNLKDIPLVVGVQHWLNSSPSQLSRKQILELIEKKILPLKNEKGQLCSLGELQEQGEKYHNKILEEIRCAQDWPIARKEELVKCYIEFCDHLYQSTLGILPKAQDPDQFYASHKAVNYDQFTKFVQFLSERDALIAKLLYFGGPTVEEVLFLRYGQLDFDNRTINFSKQSIRHPKHLMAELANFSGKKKQKELVFINYKGNQIARTHLNQSFGRASKSIHSKITPRDLLKLKLK